MHYFNEEVLGKLLKYQYKLLYPKVIFNRQKADEFCLLVWLFFFGGGACFILFFVLCSGITSFGITIT